MRIVFIFITTFFLSINCSLLANNQLTFTQDSLFNSQQNELKLSSKNDLSLKERKHVRVKAIIFTLLTGPLGGHRVYLGTRPGAPIIYSVTLGGFGILPLVDLAHLLFKKDISSFEKNPKIMMWTK